MSLQGKTAVVTGAAQGIGRAIAEKLANEGANLAIVDIDEEKANETLLLLQSIGVEVQLYIVDLRKIERIKPLYDSVIKDFGSLDIVVNGVGIMKVSHFLETTPVEWDEIMDLNAKSLYFSMQAAAKIMINAGIEGSIINLASITGKSSRPDYPIYAASKATIISTTRSAAAALAKDNIKVNAVCPGFVYTNMWDQIDDHYVKYFNKQKGEVIENMLNRIPMHRSGELYEIASIVSYLASADAGYITGQAINVDGGTVMH